uniref:Pleckstrin homology domain-containing family A member 7 n=2 Tax=Lygus hesperus TaxID=30085 RepID=A0A0A9Z2C9_LYGHE
MSSAPSTAGAYQEVPHYTDSAAGSASYKGTQPKINPTLDGQAPVPSENPQKPNWDLKFSAGDLLGRTHEELVLLLIQLRRQRAAVCKSMERCHREIEAHACLTDFDSINRLEHIQKLDDLKSRLIELEKQYEKGKPLVNLVDNMVKLGSLYQSGPQAVTSEKLEFNHKVQEQRILADERRDWERIRADHQDLQAKVEQLYRLDKLLQEESGTLHSLQEDKGVLERALGGLKSKLQGIHGNTAETEWYRRQQRLLEKELSRVRSILALNSKKLEETVAENARLEQELVVLRQKLQLSRRTTEPGGAATAALESELCRVQLLVGNLLRQRQELSAQVRQLTEKSNSLSQQIWPSLSDSFVGTALAAKKKPLSVGWIETDLDLGGASSPANDDACSNRDHNLSPLYVNTNNSEKQNAYYAEHSGYQEDCLDEISPLNARSPDPYRSDLEDDNGKRTCGSNWREKPQEIKTVRIVKRESERRQRDRDHRSGNIGIPLTSCNKRVLPEEVVLVPISEKQGNDSTVDDSSVQTEASEPPPTPGPRSDSVHAVWNIVRKNKLKGNMLGGGPVENLDPPDSVVDSPQLSPVYLSEAARKIVEEVAWQGRGEKRVIPRERRRHHTVSGLSIIAPKHLFSQRGSRDDLDMERVLRPRLTTPDVVRSTLNRTDTSFTKETIDNILGAPGKIVIPERYIPESQPQLSREEIMKRSKKADAIRKMLCETTTVAAKEGEVKEKTHSIKHQVEEEKRNREHLLQLSQILAQEVMEKSKMVAIQALASLPLIQSPIEEESDSDDSSPTNSLPLYQQRENFYS